MTTLETLAAAHLALRLRPLNRALRAAVERQAAAAARLVRPDLTLYCITDEQVGYLLDQVSGLALEQVPQSPPTPLTGQERAAEQELREQAATVGRALPLDELADRLGLAAEEQAALLLCVAPELDRSYERIFAYVLDDLNRRFPCAELIGTVTACSGADRLGRRRLLGRAGRLRRLGLLRPHGAAPSELRQELRAAPGLVDFLLGSGGELTAFAHDPGAVAIPPSFRLPPHLDATRIERLGRAVHVGDLDLVGVWGAQRAGQRDAVLAVALSAGMAVRQLPVADPDARQDELAVVACEAMDVAASLGAILWIPTDPLDDRARHVVAELLARSRTPACLSGTHPWRPAAALCSRAFAEIELATPAYPARKAMWSAALPELEPSTLENLAARYRMSSDELHAVASLARTEQRLRGNGHRSAPGEVVELAVTAVTQRAGDGVARSLRPSRTLDDLVLPDPQRRTVEEILAAFKAWPQVAESWGFASSAGGGVKALFIGEPGTGKTLAAEVIAGVLGLVLLKVDMARVVSKWVGETEKNLEAAFQHAEDSQAVLFFDEADALFGKRGEIKQGLDRFANFEVGFLLQRLEQSDCLAILASNLKENIDHAFVRRFQYVLQFPRPGQAERERIWRLAFNGAPLGRDVDAAALARLDMTGAAIAGAARNAALLAAHAASPTIDMVHAVRGVHRQYQRDARLLRPEELGHHAVWLEEVRYG